MPEKISVTLTAKDYDAICDIRGLPDGAHFLVMCAECSEDGDKWTLSGSSKAFRGLHDTIWDDLEEGIAPRKNRAALMRTLKLLS